MTSHIFFDRQTMSLKLLDQRLLPSRLEFLECVTYPEVMEAIKTLAVRGAPAIGVAGAWACVLAAREARSQPEPRKFLDKAFQRISNARPTAVNLAWAVKRQMKAATGFSIEQSEAQMMEEATKIQREDIEICRRIGKEGAALLKSGDTVLTHCNAGALATAGYGTALGVIRAAVEQGKKIQVIADETRPLLQGARLTAQELVWDNIPVTVICDNACASVMSRGLAQIAITGADRIAANGDSANKIGTLGVAIAASHYNIPFYIAAPLSTIDRTLQTGAEIPIEERPPDEVLRFNEFSVVPEGANALNFAFDVTPHDLITGIITEHGVLRPPFDSAIARLPAC